MTYGLNDICLTPARISRIEHRMECNPYNFDGMLPLFTAPMNTIIDENNYEIFLKNKINTIIPRGVDYHKRWDLSTKTFVALGLDEFETFIQDYSKEFNTNDSLVRYVCVDVANGHMKKLIDLCANAKSIFGGKLLIMTGNIANPETYIDYSKAGIDFVRIGIGGGSVCTTSANAGVHYAMASLIKAVVDIRWNIQKAIEDAQLLRINTCPYKNLPFIVADGGFDNYDKIIKALALGADYVMVGKLFAQCEEACQEIITLTSSSEKQAKIDFPDLFPDIPKKVNWKYDEKSDRYISKIRLYYGMSTKRAQSENKNKILKTAEGIEIFIPVLYKLSGWCENFISYLQSTMSYTNSINLVEFKNTKYTIISSFEYLSFHK